MLAFRTFLHEQVSASSQSNNAKGIPVHVSGFARRIHGWSWQAFPIVMGTSAVYLTLSNLKHHPAFVSRIETVFFFFNIVLFLLNIFMLLSQAILFPRHAWTLLQDPIQGIFVPLMVLSLATIVIGTVDYDMTYGHVGSDLIYALFWQVAHSRGGLCMIYLAFSIITCFPMLKIWFSREHDLAHFAPAYAFLVFPLMLTGIVAANTLKVIDASDPRALGVLLVGYIVHGLGFFMAFFYLAIYVLRLMANGFMHGGQANGAFVACGPPGFSALTLITLGDHARTIISARGYVADIAGDVWYSASVLASLLLYGLALFFFIFGIIPYRFSLRRHMNEILGCWALTFPNVGWITATRSLGDIFEIQGFWTFHLVMTILMCITWLFLFIFTVIAFCKGRIFKSRKEDVIRDIHAEESEGTPAGKTEDSPMIPPSIHHSEGSSRTATV
ncbi:voltage-dependent anion channel-domain-containing protein [Desarmillaria tabescens]|uniref:Voltage-dependent anion channel-domain-containing protein n=1 Tax=Armillaria tabescens TaxID=1929756 RepID=A0AA39K3Z3_ARMTA|nr:voltage-dependent anion channel-domain-containing protein [Desarmillaria tabescens]KAK0452754.1 voltage-dependent anion channel-domain-containing protein [Desarmillaria tabescens]